MFGKLKERLSGGSKKLSGKTDLLEGICAISALVACADGEIEDSEVAGALDALQNHPTLADAFSGTQIEQALDKQLKRANGSMTGKLALKREIEEMKSKNASDELEMALMVGIDIAMADGELEPEEKIVLTDLAKRLGFNLSNYL
ncbi:tellurite resistance TerB family protein [Thioclava sp. GXIMD4215]|uniref:tellurite resistance TerB family protein n=1 Tax=Thioclava sp. GXIMD4215 TaxID=3131928 RepID=UPI003255B7A6